LLEEMTGSKVATVAKKILNGSLRSVLTLLEVQHVHGFGFWSPSCGCALYFKEVSHEARFELSGAPLAVWMRERFAS